MVFFVCEGCNETLKKNQVDQHAQKCRSCYAVTCVDCQVTFHGNDYAAHVSCISEAEKYEKSLFKGKKAKLNPQEQWLAVVEEAVSRASDAPIAIRPHILRLGDLGNVPRNKNKFGNFIKNSLRLQSQAIIDQMWGFLESLKAANDKAAAAQDAKSDTESQSQKQSVPETVEPIVSEDTSEDRAEKKKEKKEKKNKKKDKLKEKSEVEDEACDEENLNASEEVINESNETSEENKEKKKKKKKRKADDGDDKSNHVDIELQDESSTGKIDLETENQTESEEKKKKKKKKKQRTE